MRTWDPKSPLPHRGTWLLEASAGTGKTWQLASLVCRLVIAERIPIEKILVLTFTNAATAELTERVRQRLIEAIQALDQAIETGVISQDPVLASLCATVSDLRTQDELRLRRLLGQAAVAHFDRATIFTIHGYCQRALTQMPLETGQPTDLTLTAEMREVYDYVSADIRSQAHSHLSVEQLNWVAPLLNELTYWVKQADTARGMDLRPSPTDDNLVDAVRRLWAGSDAIRTFWSDHGGGQQMLQDLKEAFEQHKVENNRKRSVVVFSILKKNVDAWVAAGCQLYQMIPKAMDFIPKKLGNIWPASVEAKLQGSDVALPDSVMRWQELFEREVPSVAAALMVEAGRRIDARLSQLQSTNFSTLLSRLASALAPDSDTHMPLAKALRAQSSVALVDEFQDTDPAQWTILRTLFHDQPNHRLWLIGDPKQAIYAFRGADVYVYLHARNLTQSNADLGSPGRYTMSRNFRSDQRFVEAMNALWSKSPQGFGQQEIEYISVDTPSGTPPWRLQGISTAKQSAADPSKRHPIEIRWLHERGDCDEDEVLWPFAYKEDAHSAAARCCAEEVLTLLNDTALTDHRGTPHATEPKDIAVLVYSKMHGKLVKQALQQLNIHAVTGAQGSVFASPAADWLQRLIEALHQPHDLSRTMSYASCPVGGWSLQRLVTLREAGLSAPKQDIERWDQWLHSLRISASKWYRQGVSGAFATMAKWSCFPQSLLTQPDGERLATDLRHLVELCHEIQRQHQMSPQRLLAWLSEQRDSQSERDATKLRLESQANAVQIVTIHSSKGLQYPIVLAPFVWTLTPTIRPKSAQPYHPKDAPNTCTIHVANPSLPASKSARDRHKIELHQEQTRLLYVAMTRAKHHCVMWATSAGKEAGRDAMTRLMTQPGDEQERNDLRMSAVKSSRGKGASDQQAKLQAAQAARRVLTRWKERFADANLNIKSQHPRWDAKMSWSPRTPLGNPKVSHAKRSRRFDRWSKASFSSLSGTIRGEIDLEMVSVGAEQDRLRGGHDQREVATRPTINEPQGLPEESLLTMNAGPQVGVWIHAILEHIDFVGADDPADALPIPKPDAPAADLPSLVTRLGAQHSHTNPQDHQRVMSSLGGLLKTSLYDDCAPNDWGLPKTFCLADIAANDRLDELRFDLGIASSDGQVGTENNQALGFDVERFISALRAESERYPDDSPTHRWLVSFTDDQGAKALRNTLSGLTGILTGIVDLVFRYRDSQGSLRYYIADYKSNRLHSSTENQLSRALAAYERPQLAGVMAEHDYYLQSLLYTVALHRLLKERLPEYDYASHFGGHLYLFIRVFGQHQTGENEGSLGVFHDRWSRPLIQAVDEALTGRGAPR